MSAIKDFGDTARGLAKNPLGIIALFIVLIYGFASLVVGASAKLEAYERTPLIWFLTIFPLIVLIAFYLLVSRHHRKLYAPSDYKQEKHFIEALKPELEMLQFAEPGPPSKKEEESTVIGEHNLKTPAERAKQRNEIYSQNRGYFLVHVIEPSNDEGQKYDIFIYLIRHKSKDYSDIASTDFFFGHYWGNKLFPGNKMGKLIGIKTAAYGPFLCTCLITFIDGGTVLLNRYIDFEMGHLIKRAFEN